MKTLTCKRCGCEYEFDTSIAAVCDKCFCALELDGWLVAEIIEKYPPHDDDEEEEVQGG